MLRLVKMTQRFFNLCEGDPELLLKHGRPCVLLVRLKYKGERHTFAVPLRSNISPSTPRAQYFPLPPTSHTKPQYRHGLHLIKMFPVAKSCYQEFKTDNDRFYTAVRKQLDRNEAKIIKQCQEYINQYEQDGKPRYAVDIDRIIALLEGKITNE